jgi:hypothetical protein
MKAPMNVKLYPRGYYECPKCGMGIEVLVRVLDKPSCGKHGAMEIKPKPKNFGKEES